MPHSWDARDYRANASMQLLLGGSFLERLPLVEDARVLLDDPAVREAYLGHDV